MVRGQKEERGDQMCFPDKITLVPAPLIQNTHRYQLARGRQGAASLLNGRQVELVSVSECVCVSVCRCSFETSKKTRENKPVLKKNKHATEDKQHSLPQDDSESPGLSTRPCIWTVLTCMIHWHCSVSVLLQ